MSLTTIFFARLTTSRLLKKAMVKVRPVTFGDRGRVERAWQLRLWGNFRPAEVAFWFLRTDSCRRRRLQLRNTDEVVGGRGDDEEPLDQAATTMTRLAQRSDCLHPAKGLLMRLRLIWLTA